MATINATLHALGPKEAGKTWLLGGSYWAFRTGNENFGLDIRADGARRIETSSPTVGTSVISGDEVDLRMETIVEAILEGRREPTLADDSWIYSLALHNGTQTCFSFDYLDYRGDVLKSNDDAFDRAAFREQLDRATCNGCVFYCVSSELLQKPLNDKTIHEVMLKGNISRMHQLAKEVPDHVPAAIVITKADKGGFPQREMESVLKDVKRLFKQWLDPEMAKGKVAAVIPVSVTEGQNVTIPYIFAAWALRLQELRELSSALGDAQSAYRRADDNDTFLAWLFADWDSGYYATMREKALATGQIELAERGIKATQAIRKALAKALSKQFIFVDGVQLSATEKESMLNS